MELYNEWVSHQHNCNYTWTTGLNLNGGTFAFRCLFATAWYAMSINRTLFVCGDSPQNLLWEEFFLLLPTSCQPPPPVILGPKSEWHDEQLQGGHVYSSNINQIFNISHVWLIGWTCPINEAIPTERAHKMAQLIWRLNENTIKEIELILSKFPRWSTTIYHSFHIRCGDKLWGPMAEARPIELKKYCEALEHALGVKKITDPVFIAADSINSIEKIKQIRPDWTIWYIDDPEFQKLRAGNFTHSHLVNWPLEDRRKWQMLLLSELTMIKWSKLFIGTESSNIWRLVNQLRPTRAPPIINLESL